MLRWCVFLVLCLILYINGEIPSYIQVCKASNPDLAKCIASSVIALKPILAKGIPELEVPSVEPLETGDLFLKGNLNLNVTNQKLHNVVSFEIVDISASYEKYQFAALLKFSNVNITGNYAIDAKLLTIPLQGHGLLNAHIGTIHLTFKFKGKRIPRDGKTYVDFRFLDFSLKDWKDVKISLSGLFPNNKQLADAANQVLEDSSDVIPEDLLPALQENLKKEITVIANKIVSKYSEDEIFPK